MMLPVQILVVLFEGAPVHFSYDACGARDFLADLLEEHGDSYQVHRVYSDSTRPEDITASFADEWAADLGYGDGADPDEYLKTFTGFVLAHQRDALIAGWLEAEEYRDSEALERSKLRRL